MAPPTHMADASLEVMHASTQHSRALEELRNVAQDKSIRERLDRYMTEFPKLNQENDTLRSEKERLQGNMQAVITSQRSQITAKDMETEQLKTELSQLYARMEKETEKLRNDLFAKEKELQECQQMAADEIRDLNAQLAELADAAGQIKRLELAKLELQEDKAKMKRDHLDKIGRLENENMREKDDIITQHKVAMDKAKQQMNAQSLARLDKKTKATMQENQNMSLDLAIQSKETQLAIDKSEQDEGTIKKLRRNVVLLEEEQTLSATRNHLLSNTITKLMGRLKSYESNDNDVRMKIELEKRAFEEELDNARRLVQLHSAAADKTDRKNDRIRKEYETTKKDLQTSRQEFERLIGLAQEGENFILACVDDVKRTATARGLMSTGDAAFPGGVDGLPDAATARGGGQQASTLSALQLDERQKVLDMLLTKLSNFNKHVKIYQGREMQGLPHISAPQPPSMSRNSSRGSGGGGSRTPRGGGAAPFGGGRSTPLGPAGLGGTGAHTARAGTMGFPRR